MDEGSISFFFFFSPWWSVLKGIHHGNVPESNIFEGGNRDKEVLMHALYKDGLTTK